MNLPMLRVLLAAALYLLAWVALIIFVAAST